MEQITLPGFAGPQDDDLTSWSLDDPPMVGWWDTLLYHDSPEGLETIGPNSPIFRRWWSGPISGWSIAVLPAMAGYPLQRVAETPFKPQDPLTRIAWRGRRTKAPSYTYKLEAQSITREALAAAMGAAVVMFPHASAGIDPAENVPKQSRKRRVFIWV